MEVLADLEQKVLKGEPLTRAEAERVLASPDLVSVGLLGEQARKAKHGNRVTFGRVCVLEPGSPTTQSGEAGELRLAGKPASIAEARERVRAAVALATGVPLTGFSAADLLDLAGGDHLGLVDVATALKREGLEALAEVPLDLLGDTENVVEVVRAVRHGGLAAWRATVSNATIDERLDLIERAATVQRDTGAFKAFAPLPRVDVADQPSTGYDDVRTIAVARLICTGISSIQVDWPLYGPKLAQVAMAYGADDIDGVAAVDTLELGPRRAPRAEIERHIRAAFADPIERDGRYETRP
jgi:aminodeoxyfutalosine synthase